MAINEYNSDLDVKGRVLATTVPNSTGSIVTWNASTNVFGLRSNAQIISDLGLSTALNNKANANGDNLTSIQTWRDSLGIGTLNSLTTTNKSNLVNAINEVNSNIPNVTGFVPYTGANQPIDLNTQDFTTGGYTNRLHSYFERINLASDSTSSGLNFKLLTNVAASEIGNASTQPSADIVITLPITTTTNWQAEIDILRLGYRTTLNIGGYDTNNASRFVSGVYGDINDIIEVKFGRIGDNTVIIIKRANSTIHRLQVNISKFYYHHTNSINLYNDKTKYKVEYINESELTDFALNGTITNAQFKRDSYLLDYNNFTNTPTIPTSSDFITTNTTQTGLSGNKTTSGLWNFNPESTTSARFEYTPSDNISSGIRLDNYDLAGNKRHADFSLNAELEIAGIGYGRTGGTLPNGSTDTSNFGMWVNNGNDLFAGRHLYVDNGTIYTGSHGNSSQWKQAYDWGNYALNSIVFNNSTNNPTNSYNGLDADLTLNSSRLFFTNGVNTPISSGFIDTTVYSNGGFQMVQGDHDNFYYRRRFGGTWRPWNQVASREWADSRFALASSIITPNNGLLTISTSSDLTGGGTFSADQATASNVDIGLSAGTLSNIQLGVTAHGWGNFRDFGLGDTVAIQDIDNPPIGSFFYINSLTQNFVERGLNYGVIATFNGNDANGGSWFQLFGSYQNNRGLAYRRKRNGTIYDFIQVVDESNLDSQATSLGFIKSSALPTVNNGALTLTTGTGLSGSANFTANQSGGSTFTVGIASTHKLPTTAEWNALPTTDTTYTGSNGIDLVGTDFRLSSSTLASLALANTAVQPSTLNGYVQTSRTITAGNGLSGGGTLASNRTITLGTPSSIGLSTTDSVTPTSHTHALDSATTTAINQGVTAHGWGDHFDKYVTLLGESRIESGGRLTISNNDHSGWFNNTVGDTENYYTRRNFSINSANNQMSFFIHGGFNSRRAGIQVGHSESFDNTGILELNPFGGTVRINGNDSWHSGNLTNVSQLNNDVGYITSATANYLTINNSSSSVPNGAGLNTSGAFDLDTIVGSVATYTSANTGTPFSSGFILTQFETSSGNTTFQLGNRGDVFAYRGKVSGNFGSWLTVASREWVTAQNYLTSVPDSFVTKNNISSSALATTVIDFNNTGNGASILYAGASSTNRPVVSGTAGGLLIRGNHSTVGEYQLYLARGEADAMLYRNQSGIWYRGASREWVNSQNFSTQTLSSSSSNIISGSTVQRAALTGDVTASQNSNVTTIANSAVTHAKYQNIPTQRILGRGAAGTGNVQELTLGSNLSLSTTGVLSATNTNTTYSAGTGLSLSGTTFGQAITTSGSGTYVQSITQTASGFQVNLGTPPNTTYSAGTVALLTAGTNQTNRVWRADYLNQGIKALTYNPDNLTFGSGLNYNTSTGVLTADLDSIFAYSPQGGLYTTNWSSNALGQYSLAIGHASNATAQNATAVGSAVFTGGFGSTNVGFSSNVNKSLAGNFGTYNTNNHRESFTYGLGLQSASTWQTVMGRYNKPNGAGDIDNWTDIRNPIFILGVGQDEMNRKNAVSAFGDGRLDYETDRDDTHWNPNTIPDIKWIQENIPGGGGGSSQTMRIDHNLTQSYTSSEVNGLVSNPENIVSLPAYSDPMTNTIQVLMQNEYGNYTSPDYLKMFNNVGVYVGPSSYTVPDILVNRGVIFVTNNANYLSQFKNAYYLVYTVEPKNSNFSELVWLTADELFMVKNEPEVVAKIIGNIYQDINNDIWFNVNPQIL